MKKLLMKIMNRIMLPCEIITQKVSESLDHKLSLRERIQVYLHLMYCKFCKRYQIQLLAIHNALQKQGEQEGTGKSAENLSTAAREKMKRALREKSRPSE